VILDLIVEHRFSQGESPSQGYNTTAHCRLGELQAAGNPVPGQRLGEVELAEPELGLEQAHAAGLVAESVGGDPVGGTVDEERAQCLIASLPFGLGMGEEGGIARGGRCRP